MGIARHFASIAGGVFGARQVHYRRAGNGPAVLLLHQSPMSSRDLLPVIERWQSEFTLIAPDTPGYGLSDPFGREPVTMDDIADGVIELLDALGIERIAAYGFHTGAMIAGALAARHPQRLSCAVANGYVVMGEAERADFLAHYLPRFEPRWDGSHLTWLWARLREQTIFFPWYRASQATRMRYDVPKTVTLRDNVNEFLRAGDHYRVAYHAAFAFESLGALRAAAVPTLVTAASHDPLHASLALLAQESLPGTVELRSGGDLEGTLATARDFLRRHAAPPPPAPVPAGALPGRLHSEFVQVTGGQLRLRRAGSAEQPQLLLLHGADGSSATLAPLAQELAGARHVLAPDLPGHGDSDGIVADHEVGPLRYAEVLRQALVVAGAESVAICGFGLGGAVGLELARLAPGLVRRLLLVDPVLAEPALLAELRARYAPPLEANWYGGYLLQAWHLVRDQALFWPWYARNREHVVPGEPQVDPASVHARVCNLLNDPQRWRLAQLAEFDYPLAAALAQCAVPVALGRSPAAANPAALEAFAARHAPPRCIELPHAAAARAVQLLAWLDH
jgi:pimeloyl-ACP methyl ester carboxylesterase